jgi:uncharacterized delta-60 repeat protein
MRHRALLPVLLPALGLAGPVSGAREALTYADPLYGDGGSVSAPDDTWRTSFLPDGRLLSARTGDAGLVLSRRDRDGQLDASFGNQGERILSAGPLKTDAPYLAASAVAPDGSVYLSYVQVTRLPSDHSRTAKILRVTPEGEIDAAFGPGGRVDLPIVGDVAHVNQISVLADGNLAVLYSNQGYYDCFYGSGLVRLLRTGNVGTPGTFGEFRAPPPACNFGERIDALPEGGIAFSRQPDDGPVDPPLFIDSLGRAALLPAEVEMLLGGSLPFNISSDSTRTYLSAVSLADARQAHFLRLASDLSVDHGFGQVGVARVRFPLPTDPRLQYVAFDVVPGSDGQYLFAMGQLKEFLKDGSYSGYTGTVIARLLPSGSLDPSFGAQGFAFIPAPVASLKQQPGGDLLAELGYGPSRTFRIRADEGRGGPGIISFMEASYAQAIEGSAVVVHIGRFLGSSGAVSVRYSLKSAIATPGEDYEDVSGTLSWADGETGTKEVRIALVDDTAGEDWEVVSLQLDSPTAGAMLLRDWYAITIESNDGGPPVPVVTAPGATAPVGASPNAGPTILSGGGGSLDLITLAMFSMPLVALARLRRPSDMGSSLTVVPYLLMLFGLALPMTVQARSGDMDPHFGVAGRIEIPEGYSGVSTLPDGRIQMFWIGAGQLVMRRYQSDGHPDASLGSGGLAALGPVPLDPDPGYVATVTEGGTTWLAVSKDKQHWLLRIDANGRFDAGFGQGGIFTIPVDFGPASSGATSFTALAATAAGAFYLLFESSSSSINCVDDNTIRRYMPDGEPDLQFGRDGAVNVTPVCDLDSIQNTIVPLGEDSVLYVSWTQDYPYPALARLLDTHGQPREMPPEWSSWIASADLWHISVSGPYLYTQRIWNRAGSITRWRLDLTPDRSFGEKGNGQMQVPLDELMVGEQIASRVTFLPPRASDTHLYFRVSLWDYSVPPLPTLGPDRGTVDDYLGRVSLQGALDRSFGEMGYVRTGNTSMDLYRSADGSVLAGIQGYGIVRLSADSISSPGVLLPGLSCKAADPYANFVQEVDRTWNVEVSRVLGANGPATLNYRTRALRARPGVDYIDTSGTLRWGDGDSETRSFALRTLVGGSHTHAEDFEILFDTPGAPAVACPRSVVNISPTFDALTSPQFEATAAPTEKGGGGTLGGCGLGVLFALLASRLMACKQSRTMETDHMKTRTTLRFGAPVLLALCLPVLALGGGKDRDSDWKSIGPAPPAVEAAVVSDPESGTMLVGGTGGGILRSSDRGRSFAYANTGLSSLTIISLLMDRTTPNVVYAGTTAGIHKSTDGGATWQNMGGSIGAVILVMDPVDHNILYAGQSPNGGVIKSTDGGASWATVNTGLGAPPVFGLAIDPRNPQVLYAGTAGVGAWRTADGGQSWSKLDIDTSVWSMLVDPEQGGVVYAGTNGSGVFRSQDGGLTFQRVGSPRSGVVYSLARSGGRLYAATANHGASVSFDGGITWQNTGAADSQGLVLSVDPRGNVFLGTSFDGALALRNQGPLDDTQDEEDERARGWKHERHWHRLAWQQLRDCACQNGHAITVDPGDHRHVMLSTNDGGLLESRSGGQDWQDAGSRGMTARGPRGIAFDPVDSRYVYVAGFTGMGFFRSENNGRTWERRVFGSAAMYTTGVAVDASDRAVYVASLSGDGVWKSRDFGNTFERVDRAAGAAPGVFLNLSGRGVSVDPQRAGVVYVAASRGASAGVWRSLDAGATWQRVSTSPVLSVTVDPTNPLIVYAATPVPTVLKSIDGGATFASMSAGLPANFQTSRTGSVQVNPFKPWELWVGLEGAGVYRSLDSATTWVPASDGLQNLFVFGLALDPRDPQHIYATTEASVFSKGAYSRSRNR